MLLTISTTRRPATDLGYLLHKNPARCRSFELSFGKAHVFYPEADDDRCTMALLLDFDPIGLVRKPKGSSQEAISLEQYVNDRPYVASSFLSVAIAQVFGTALAGRCKDRPEIADRTLPLSCAGCLSPWATLLMPTGLPARRPRLMVGRVLTHLIPRIRQIFLPGEFAESERRYLVVLVFLSLFEFF